MKLLKRIALTAILLLILLIAGLSIMAFFYKDKLIEKGVTAVNNQINGELSIADASLSLFQSFPDLHLALIEPVISVQSDTILQAESAAIAVSLSALWNSDKPLAVKKFALSQPIANLRISKNGSSNFDILVIDSKNSAASDSKDFSVELRQIQILDGSLFYEDLSSGLKTIIHGLDHMGNGDFTSSHFDYNSTTSAAEVLLAQNGIAYLDRVVTEIDAVIEVDLEKQLYTLKDNEVRINDLALLLDGFLIMQDEQFQIDLNFEAPDNDLRQFISLIPGAYTEDFEDLQTEGTFRLNGSISGIYKGEDEYPAMDVNCILDNGRLQYPSLSEPVEQIEATISLKKEQGSLDLLKINAEDLRFTISGNPLQGSFAASNLMSDPFLNGNLRGSLELASMKRALPMEESGLERGKAEVDLTASFRMSDIQNENYDHIELDGRAEAWDLLYKSSGAPDLDITNAVLTMNSGILNFNAGTVKSGESDFDITGKIFRPLHFFSKRKPVRSEITIRAGTLDINSWMAAESGEKTDPTAEIAEPLKVQDQPIPYLQRLEAKVNLDAASLLYEDYVLTDLSGSGTYHYDQLQIDRITASLMGETVNLEGRLSPISGYLLGNDILKGKLVIHSERLDLNKWMKEDPIASGSNENTAEESPAPLRIPEDLNVQLIASAEQVHYQDMTIMQVKGGLNIEDGRLEIHDVIGKTMGGDLIFNGVYSQVDDVPVVDMKAQLNRISFQKIYDQLVTFRALAPIAEFIDGNFNSTLAYNSSLQPNYLPELGSITMDGFVQTFDAVIRKFKPLEKIGEFLQIDEFKGLPLESSKNWFSISHGTITVEPTDLQVEDVKMKISGTYNLDHKINFLVKAEVPQSYVQKLNLNKFLDQGKQTLEQQASRLGLSLNTEKPLQFDLLLTGSIENPDMKVALVGMGKSTLKETVQEQASETLTELKDTLLGTVSQQGKEKLDTLKSDLTKKASDIARDQLNNLLKGKKDSTSTTTPPVGSKADEAIQKAKDKLNNFDPFKKKKKKKEGG